MAAIVLLLIDDSRYTHVILSKSLAIVSEYLWQLLYYNLHSLVVNARENVIVESIEQLTSTEGSINAVGP